MSLPNISYVDEKAIGSPSWMDDTRLNLKLKQDMDTERRANMVRRLPKSFREKVYFQFQRKWGIPGREFKEMLEASKDETASGGYVKPVGSAFDRRIVAEKDLPEMVIKAINQTVYLPAAIQSFKGILSAGPARALQYLQEKRQKGKMQS